MTAPITHGYPDWGRFAAQSTVIYNRESATVTNGTVVRGPFFVGDVEALGLSFFSGNNEGMVFLVWSADEAGAEVMAIEEYHITDLGNVNIGIPVAGPWVEAQVVIGAAGTLTFDLILWAMPKRRTFPDAPGNNILISSVNTAIAAGATATNNATRTWPGPAYWSGWQGVSNFVVFLEALDANGNVYTLDRWQGAGQDFRTLIFLPALPCRIRHVNQTGGANVYTSQLIAAHSLITS